MQQRSGGHQFPAIVFVVRDQLFALEQFGAASLLPWLQRYVKPSALPGVPEWCLGLLNVRGTVQTVADLGCLLGFGPSDITDQSRLIFIEQGTAQLGLAVDREIGIRMLRSADLSSEVTIPFLAHGAQLSEGTVLVLDGAAILRYISSALRAPAYSS